MNREMVMTRDAMAFTMQPVIFLLCGGSDYYIIIFLFLNKFHRSFKAK